MFSVTWFSCHFPLPSDPPSSWLPKEMLDQSKNTPPPPPALRGPHFPSSTPPGPSCFLLLLPSVWPLSVLLGAPSHFQLLTFSSTPCCVMPSSASTPPPRHTALRSDHVKQHCRSLWKSFMESVHAHTCRQDAHKSEPDGEKAGGCQRQKKLLKIHQVL